LTALLIPRCCVTTSADVFDRLTGQIVLFAESGHRQPAHYINNTLRTQIGPHLPFSSPHIAHIHYCSRFLCSDLFWFVCGRKMRFIQYVAYANFHSFTFTFTSPCSHAFPSALFRMHRCLSFSKWKKKVYYEGGKEEMTF
jgi:hypothetical protein